MNINDYIGNIKGQLVTVVQNAETFESLRPYLDVTYTQIEAVTITVSDEDRVLMLQNEDEDVEVHVHDYYTSSKGSLWNRALEYKQKGSKYLAYASQVAAYKTKFNLDYLAKVDAEKLVLPVPFDGKIRPAPFKLCFINIKGSANQVMVRQSLVSFKAGVPAKAAVVDNRKVDFGFTPLSGAESMAVIKGIEAEAVIAMLGITNPQLLIAEVLKIRALMRQNLMPSLVRTNRPDSPITPTTLSKGMIELVGEYKSYSDTPTLEELKANEGDKVYKLASISGTEVVVLVNHEPAESNKVIKMLLECYSKDPDKNTYKLFAFNNFDTKYTDEYINETHSRLFVNLIAGAAGIKLAELKTVLEPYKSELHWAAIPRIREYESQPVAADPEFVHQETNALLKAIEYYEATGIPLSYLNFKK